MIMIYFVNKIGQHKQFGLSDIWLDFKWTSWQVE